MFLLPSGKGGDYRLRIFNATGEMRFAGHPRLCSCAAWLHAGGVPQNKDRVIQDCDIGLVEIDLTGRAPASLASEDPVTGSLIAALACWLHGAGRLTAPIVLAQGTALGRQGRAIAIPRDNDIWIGGHTNIVIDGHVTL